jgi:hypothetical protein
MAIFNFRRKPMTQQLRQRRTAPLLPEPMDRPDPIRRVHRVGAGVALLGAVGTVALAVAMAPGAPPPASSASYASERALALGEVKTESAPVAVASPPEIVLAALPQRAAKSDRLLRKFRAPQPAAVDRRPDSELARELASELASELARDLASEPAPPEPAPEAVPEATPELIRGTVRNEVAESDVVTPAAPKVAVSSEPDIEPESSDSLAPDDAGADDASADDPDAAVATRSAPVTTDVNLRAGPDNAAAVVTVVPASSHVEVIACDYWCEVVFAGKRGWIYKGFVGFVRGAGS